MPPTSRPRPALVLLILAALLLPALSACKPASHPAFKPTHQPSGR